MFTICFQISVELDAPTINHAARVVSIYYNLSTQQDSNFVESALTVLFASVAACCFFLPWLPGPPGKSQISRALCCSKAPCTSGPYHDTPTTTLQGAGDAIARVGVWVILADADSLPV